MKTVKIPGLVFLIAPFIIYIIYWFISQSIEVFNDVSLCYCTTQGLNEAPPTFLERLFYASLVIFGMFAVLMIIEYIVNIWTKHLKKDDLPYSILSAFFIPMTILYSIDKGLDFINDKLTVNIKY